MTRSLTKSAGMLNTPAPGPSYPMVEIDGFPSVSAVKALIESDRRGEAVLSPTNITMADIDAMAPSDWLTRAMGR